ncbi:MAG: hypothetical protein GXY20_12500 [Clostridiales bacterium]|nr:hypothetical protein [Clostridiales bacterium]
MPYITVNTAKKIEPDAEQKLVDAIGVSLSSIPGKDVQWTMVAVNNAVNMYFGGKKQDDMVFLDVKYVGKQEYHRKKEFTRSALAAVHEILGTPMDRICLTISEFNNWGALGDFRDLYYGD